MWDRERRAKESRMSPRFLAESQRQEARKEAVYGFEFTFCFGPVSFEVLECASLSCLTGQEARKESSKNFIEWEFIQTFMISENCIRFDSFHRCTLPLVPYLLHGG